MVIIDTLSFIKRFDLSPMYELAGVIRYVLYVLGLGTNLFSIGAGSDFRARWENWDPGSTSWKYSLLPQPPIVKETTGSSTPLTVKKAGVSLVTCHYRFAHLNLKTILKMVILDNTTGLDVSENQRLWYTVWRLYLRKNAPASFKKWTDSCYGNGSTSLYWCMRSDASSNTQPIPLFCNLQGRLQQMDFHSSSQKISTGSMPSWVCRTTKRRIEQRSKDDLLWQRRRILRRGTRNLAGWTWNTTRKQHSTFTPTKWRIGEDYAYPNGSSKKSNVCDEGSDRTLGWISSLCDIRSKSLFNNKIRCHSILEVARKKTDVAHLRTSSLFDANLTSWASS